MIFMLQIYNILLKPIPKIHDLLFFYLQNYVNAKILNHELRYSCKHQMK